MVVAADVGSVVHKEDHEVGLQVDQLVSRELELDGFVIVGVLDHYH